MLQSMVSQGVRRDLVTEQQLYVDTIHICTIHPVTVYSSVIFNIFTELCSHCHG